jgi:RHS repeat-associated protein
MRSMSRACKWLVRSGLQARAGQVIRLTRGYGMGLGHRPCAPSLEADTSGKPTRGSRALAVVSLALLMCLAAPALASAESVCTDTFSPTEGSWQIAGNWSAGHVPSSTDVACIGSGKTATVSSGTNEAAVVQGEGTLSLTGGTLAVSSALEPSAIRTLTMTGGTLTGAATVKVTSSLTWKEGTMSGSGSTALQSGASATATNSKLAGRTFINEGTVTSNATFAQSEGAKVENKGTFYVNSSVTHAIYAEGSGPTPTFVNMGSLKRASGEAEAEVSVKFENKATVQEEVGTLSFSGGGSSTSGKWSASEKTAISFKSETFSLTGDSLSGAIDVTGATVTAESLSTTGVELAISSGSFSLPSGSLSIATLSMTGGTLTGAGTVDVASSLFWKESRMTGSGATVLQAGASGKIGNGKIAARTFVNEATITETNTLWEAEGAKFENKGTFNANQGVSDSVVVEGSGAAPLFVNAGTFQKTAEAVTGIVNVNFENFGAINEVTGKFEFQNPVFTQEASSVYGGPESPSTPGRPCPVCGEPVTIATGNLVETQTDVTVGGRGVGLSLTRTYNSQAAVEKAKGLFGYGWSASFGDSLSLESKKITLHGANGASVPFTESGATFTAPVWTQDRLSGSAEAGYTLTYPNQTQYKFSGSNGRLESITDHNGNATTLAYNVGGHLETVTDPSGRKLKLAYNAEGLVESVEDPMKHVVKYAYESGNLASVTLPGESSSRWSFKYDSSHQLTELTDGRGGKTVNQYNANYQVTKQTDPLKRELGFAYEPFRTKVTNTASGAVTEYLLSSADEPVTITRGAGTSLATTESFAYNEGGYVTSATDGNKHTTTYGYDAENNRTSMVDADKNETKWDYDSTHDVTSVTTPKGEKTTIKRDSHGNVEAIERPASGEKTQTTKYKYGSHGELESVEDPLKRVWKYEYDAQGDRSAEIDPEGDKRTFKYDEDSFETSSVSPRGNQEGAEASKYTTKVERDEQERLIKVTDPLGRTTKYTYDGNGNLEALTDPRSHTTTYTYDAANELTKVKEPSGITTETEYDGEGHVIAQIDGNKYVTKYVRNVLGEVKEIEDALGRKTVKEYDAAGNLEKLKEEKEKLTTTYKYDAANRLTEVSYSDGKTHSVTYEYDADGDRTKMVDGTGTSKYTYDQLDRLTEVEDGHKDVAKYEYDLANQLIKITYPNGKAVAREYDNAGRLKKVTDWAEHATTFGYDANSNLKSTTWPVGTSGEDKDTYNEADQLTNTEMKKGSEELASLTYARDPDGQLESTTQKGLPGEEKTSYTYDENNRLTKAGPTGYKYDAANNPTEIGSLVYVYDHADEITERTHCVYFAYNNRGERAGWSYGEGCTEVIPRAFRYNQAGNLIAFEEGGKPEIKDAYAYNGDGLRTSETIGSSTKYLAWDVSGSLPLLLSDGTNSYIYGPGGVPIEQIASGGTALYLHQDQQSSTRLLTNSGGTKEASFTYDAYGNQTGHTGTATTPLGYDGQYTSADSGLIYLRTRTYDPTTAQFLTVDPVAGLSREPYSYGSDNPTNAEDPTGLLFGTPGTPTWEQIGTRFVGFWDGLTQPVFGGTAALRSALGLSGGLDVCSAEYQIASNIGSLDLSLEAGAAGGGLAGAGIRGLGALRVGAVKLAPVVAPIVSGAVGGTVQTIVAGHEPTFSTVGKGIAGGLVGELATGLFPGTSASGVAGAVNTAFGFVW